jgi:hypothetical protein
MSSGLAQPGRAQQPLLARWMKQLTRRYDATMVYGHDATVLAELLAQGRAFD